MKFRTRIMQVAGVRVPVGSVEVVSASPQPHRAPIYNWFARDVSPRAAVGWLGLERVAAPFLKELARHELVFPLEWHEDEDWRVAILLFGEWPLKQGVALTHQLRGDGKFRPDLWCRQLAVLSPEAPASFLTVDGTLVYRVFCQRRRELLG